MGNTKIAIRKLYRHKAGTLYVSLPPSFSDILNEDSVVAYPSNDGGNIILKPASSMGA